MNSDEALTKEHPANIECVRLALATHDAGYPWEVESEYVADLLQAHDKAADTITRLEQQLQRRDGELERADETIIKLSGQIASAKTAAERVCWFDWSDNDPDACAAIEVLRSTLTELEKA